MDQDAALDSFISELLADKDLSGMTEEAKSYLMLDLKSRLLDQINRALISAMPESKLQEFNTMLDEGKVTDEQLAQYVVDSGVDVQSVVARTAIAFRGLYLQNSEQRAAFNAENRQA